MPREKRQFENGELYHITLRRIADELLFKDIDDYFRGVFGIYEFNNANIVRIYNRRRERAQFKKNMAEFLAIQETNLEQGLTLLKINEFIQPQCAQIQQMATEPDRRSKLIEVLSFVLMPNHLHLILRQITREGISKYMQKLGSGLAAYFFDKYYANIKKRGHFFQDRFNAVHIETDRQLRVALVYDWTNPIALLEPNWKEKGIKNTVETKKFLEKYKWSSYQDCLGVKNFPSIIEAEKDFLMEVMGGVEGCESAVNNWISHKGEIAKLSKNFPKLFLE